MDPRTHELKENQATAARRTPNEGFPDRLQRVLADLHQLQNELHSALRIDPTKDNLDRVLDELLSFELLTDLKATLDSTRTLLWAYREVQKQTPALDRTQRTTRMLELIRARLSDSLPDEAGSSFLSRIDRFVDERLRQRADTE